MSRSTVDLPHPDGPRMQMNSPLPATSGTEKVTFLMIVRSPKRFVTFVKSTTFGVDAAVVVWSATLLLDRAIREEAALEEEQQAVDTVGEQPDDHQDQNDVFRQAAPLARHEQVPEPVLGVDQLGEHDIAERQ